MLSIEYRRTGRLHPASARPGAPPRFGNAPPPAGDAAPKAVTPKPPARKAIWLSVALNVLSSASLLGSTGIWLFQPAKPSISSAQKRNPATTADGRVLIGETDWTQFYRQLKDLPPSSDGLGELVSRRLAELQRIEINQAQHQKLAELLSGIGRTGITPETLKPTTDQLVEGLRGILDEKQFQNMERHVSRFAEIMQPQKPSNADWWVDFLHRMGWLLMSINILFETYNSMLFSARSRQPALLASKIIAVGLAPVQAAFPIMPVRAAMGFDAVLATWGWANMLRNDRNEALGRPRGREYDMAPLFVDPEELGQRRGLLDKHGQPRRARIHEVLREYGRKAGTQEWWRHVGGASRFIFTDFGHFWKDTSQRTVRHFRQPGGLKQIAKNDLKAMRDTKEHIGKFMRGEVEYLPDALASQYQARLGAMIGAVTNIPMMIWGNDPDFVQKMNFLSVILGTPGKLTLFLQTFEDRSPDAITKLKNRWIRAGILPSYVTDAFAQYDWAVGSGRLLMGVPFQLYQIADIRKKDAQEAAQKVAQAKHPTQETPSKPEPPRP